MTACPSGSACIVIPSGCHKLPNVQCLCMNSWIPGVYEQPTTSSDTMQRIAQICSTETNVQGKIEFVMRNYGNCHLVKLYSIFTYY